MKLQLTQENLNKALTNVARVAISSRNPLPILNNILLKTVDNRLTVSATNLEIAITEHVGAKVSVEGSVTVPARLFQEYIASLPAGNIDLSVKDNKVYISTGSYKSTINGMAADEFPVIPNLERTGGWTIGTKELKRGLSQVIFAAANDETRPLLTGVYLHTHEGYLYAVATDSYRLAEKRLVALKKEVSLVVPSTALQDLMRIIGDSPNDEVKIYEDGQQVLFSVGESELISRLVDGNYPDYRKLIPASFTITADFDRTELANVTKVASLFARESAGSIIVSFNEANKKVSISSVASQLGENSSTIDTKVIGSGEVSLNSRYLIDALGAFHGDITTFMCNGRVEACILRSPDEEDYLHVIMPLKS